MDGSRHDAKADELLIERVFDAPRALMFKLWTDADFARRWFGPEGFSCIHFEGDARPGGRWKGGMRNDATGQEHWAEGEFRELTPPAHILYTYGWADEGMDTLIDIRFEETADGQTLMRFRQGPFATASSRDGHVEGWSSAFNKLAALAAEGA